MASNYPTSIDSFNDPLSNSPLNNPSHAGQHQDLNDAVEKLETKLGVTASPAASASAGHVLTATGSGSTWQVPAVTAAQFANVGLVYVTSTTVGSAVSSVTVSNCFSSTYTAYLIQFVGIKSGAQVGTQFQLSGITTGYNYQGFYMLSGSSTITGFNGVNGAYWDAGATDTGASFHTMTVLNPNVAAAKAFIAHASGTGGTNLGVQTFGQNASTSTATGFTVTPGASTLTGGTIVVYGYRKG